LLKVAKVLNIDLEQLKNQIWGGKY
jgi:hypothetical protein